MCCAAGGMHPDNSTHSSQSRKPAHLLLPAPDLLACHNLISVCSSVVSCSAAGGPRGAVCMGPPGGVPAWATPAVHCTLRLQQNIRPRYAVTFPSHAACRVSTCHMSIRFGAKNPCNTWFHNRLSWICRSVSCPLANKMGRPGDWRLVEALSSMGGPGHEAGAFLADHVVDGAILLPVQT